MRNLGVLNSAFFAIAFVAHAQTTQAFVFGPTDSFSARSQVAPGQIATFIISGLSVQADRPLKASSLPLPTTLAGISAQITGLSDPATPVPLLEVAPTGNCANSLYPTAPCSPVIAVTMEIPTEILDSDPNGDGIAAIDSLLISDQSGNKTSIIVQVIVNAIHVLTSCLTNFNNVCKPVVTRSDGSSLGVVHGGDVLTVYLYGLGKTNPIIPSGAPAPLATLASVVFPVVLNFDFQPNAAPIRPPFNPFGYSMEGYAKPLFAGASPGFVGLYQVNFLVPAIPPGTPACGGNIGSNLTITLLGQVSLDGFSVCVEQ